MLAAASPARRDGAGGIRIEWDATAATAAAAETGRGRSKGLFETFQQALDSGDFKAAARSLRLAEAATGSTTATTYSSRRKALARREEREEKVKRAVDAAAKRAREIEELKRHGKEPWKAL